MTENSKFFKILNASFGNLKLCTEVGPPRGVEKKYQFEVRGHN
jgi:hypothetical protein